MIGQYQGGLTMGHDEQNQPPLLDAAAEESAEIRELSLWTLNRQLVELIAFRDNEDLTAEETAAVDGEIRKFVEAEVERVDNLRWYVRHAETMAAAAREEEKRQQRLALTWERRVERVKGFIGAALRAFGKTRAEGKSGRFRLQKNGGILPLDIYDEKQLPTKYTPMVVSYPPDLEAIRRDLEAGVEVPGARLGERGSHLRVE